MQHSTLDFNRPVFLVSGASSIRHQRIDLYFLHALTLVNILPRDIMLARYILSSCVRPSVHLSVRPSVCPSQAGAVPKRLNVG